MQCIEACCACPSVTACRQPWHGFWRWTAPPRRGLRAASWPAKALLDQQLLPDFKNERKLRDYQVSRAGQSSTEAAGSQPLWDELEPYDLSMNLLWQCLCVLVSS